MCECARVDDDPAYVSLAVALGTKAGGCVNAVDDGAFVVGLEGLEGQAVRSGESLCGGFDVCESLTSIDGWFAGTEEVEVWSVDNEDRHCCADAMLV